MGIEIAKEKIAGSINTVEIGAAARLQVGGETTLPFLFSEGGMPNAPVVVPEILDCEPADWPDHLAGAVKGVSGDPVEWARFMLSETGAKALCVRLQGTHPDYGGKSPDSAGALIGRIAKEVKVPLIVVGSGDESKDSETMPKISQALKGGNSLLGIATQNNYKTLAATCLADGHSIIAESPIDVNIAKQVNILISDMGFDPGRIVMHPTTASLGYGMEYVYSIMERARLAAFMGDAMLSMPFILFAGQEVWRTKEAKESGEGQGVNWEIATSVAMLQAGGEIIVMRHPAAAKSVIKYIDRAMRK
ncbi:MAG: acetyl-CoA decarbonylase/synthase complex subunit delta [Candidatus Omnitrophota bacterium]